MIVTIAGKPGSGKSTVAKLLAKKLKFKVFSAGDLRGQIAIKHGMTIDQLNEVCKKERWTDEECDKLLAKMGKEQDNIIFDSRLAWHFVPNSLKIFLDVDLYESAKRIFANQRKDEAKVSTTKEMYDKLVARQKGDVARFKKWYGVDVLDMKKYDAVIDTTKLSQKQVLKKVVEAVNKEIA